MLGVAVLLASSSMAAIELITLYARLDNAVHKMRPPPASHLSPCLLSARYRKDSYTALEELESFSSLFSLYVLLTMKGCCSHAELLVHK